MYYMPVINIPKISEQCLLDVNFLTCLTVVCILRWIKRLLEYHSTFYYKTPYTIKDMMHMIIGLLHIPYIFSLVISEDSQKGVAKKIIITQSQKNKLWCIIDPILFYCSLDAWNQTAIMMYKWIFLCSRRNRTEESPTGSTWMRSYMSSSPWRTQLIGPRSRWPKPWKRSRNSSSQL